MKYEQLQFIVIHDILPFHLLRGTLTPTKYSLLRGVLLLPPFSFYFGQQESMQIEKINKKNKSHPLFCHAFSFFLFYLSQFLLSSPPPFLSIFYSCPLPPSLHTLPFHCALGRIHMMDIHHGQLLTCHLQERNIESIEM